MDLERQIQLWRHYEDVAMHFNGLLIHLRSQALGAVSVIITGAGLFVSHQATAPAPTSGSLVSWPIAAAVAALLLVAWTTLWVVDVCYYSRLLRGAVNALLQIEEQSEGQIRLSTDIERMFGSPNASQTRLNWPVKFFYIPISVVLSVFIIVSVCLAARG